MDPFHGTVAVPESSDPIVDAARRALGDRSATVTVEPIRGDCGGTWRAAEAATERKEDLRRRGFFVLRVGNARSALVPREVARSLIADGATFEGHPVLEP